jgi:hypothetical protein
MVVAYILILMAQYSKDRGERANAKAKPLLKSPITMRTSNGNGRMMSP